MSIRWRLTLSYGIASCLLLLLIASTVYIMLERRLLARTDEILREECDELALEIRLATDLPELRRQLAHRFSQHETFDFQVFILPSNQRVFRSQRLQEIDETKLPDPQSAVPFRTQSIAAAGMGECRIAVGQVNAFQHQFLYQVIVSLSDYQDELADFVQVLLIAGPLGIVGALGIGYWLSRRALSPVDCMIATAEGITAARREERLAPTHPEDELGRLAKTLNGMIDRLDAAVSDQQKFTADAAHELRTPLAILKTEVEVARRHPRTPEEYRQTLDVVLAEINRLTQLTNELLLLSRQDAGLDSAIREPVELVPLIADVVEQLRTTAATRQVAIAFQASEAVVVAGDDLQLSRLFFNLLENALKYSGAGSVVRVEVGVEGKWATVQVADTGPGIAPEHLPHLFKRFYRVDPGRSRQQGGTGLGLAICHSIAHAHHGEIHLESAPGLGTKVQVRLPALPSEH